MRWGDDLGHGKALRVAAQWYCGERGKRCGDQKRAAENGRAYVLASVLATRGAQGRSAQDTLAAWDRITALPRLDDLQSDEAPERVRVLGIVA